jgi:hypothetical protein
MNKIKRRSFLITSNQELISIDFRQNQTGFMEDFRLRCTVRLLIQLAGLQNAEGLEESISSPGVQETRLSIMVQQDQVELLNEIINLLKTPQGRRDDFPLKQ